MKTPNVNNQMKALPKHLRDEVKKDWLFDACFTDATRRTVRDSHAMLVTSGLDSMLVKRQQMLLTAGRGNIPALSLEEKVNLLTDIECIRLVVSGKDFYTAKEG